MPASETLEPSEQQLKEELSLFTMLQFEYEFIFFSAKGAKQEQGIVIPNYEVYQFMAVFFDFFHGYFQRHLGINKAAYVPRKEIMQPVSIMTTKAIPESKMQMYMELEKKRGELLTRILHPEYLDYIKKLSFSQREIMMLVFFILFMQYWFLSEQLFGIRTHAQAEVRAIHVKEKYA